MNCINKVSSFLSYLLDFLICGSGSRGQGTSIELCALFFLQPFMLLKHSYFFPVKQLGRAFAKKL